MLEFRLLHGTNCINGRDEASNRTCYTEAAFRGILGVCYCANMDEILMRFLRHLGVSLDEIWW